MLTNEPLWAGPSSKKIIHAVRDFFDKNRISPTQLYIGLSGGPDSLALTAAIAKLSSYDANTAKTTKTTNTAKTKQYSLAKTHVTAIIIDHRLQDNSQEFSQEASAQAQQLGILTKIVPVTVVTQHGMEADARIARYRALQEHAAGAPIVLGHTLDDQAETVLLGLCRGSGPRSISGMPAGKGNIFRPLLTVRRKDTIQACHEWGLTPLLDNHNFAEKYLRVKIRGAVMPLLAAELNPNIAQSLARTAELIAEDTAILDELAGEILPQVLHDHHLLVNELAYHRQGIRTRVIRLWLAEQGFTAHYSQLIAIDKLVSDYHGQGPVAIAPKESSYSIYDSDIMHAPQSSPSSIVNIFSCAASDMDNSQRARTNANAAIPQGTRSIVRRTKIAGQVVLTVE